MSNSNLISQISLAGYLITFLFLLRICSIKVSRTWFIPLFALYFGLVFATLLAVFFDGAISSRLLSENSLPILILDAFNPLNGRGRVMFGGYFGSIFGIWLANSIFWHKSLSEFLDISAISWSIFLVIFRIGCFVGGCCYGIPCSFGISFHKSTSAFRHLRGTDLIAGDSTVPLLPTQLISSGGNLIIFLFLLILFCKNKTRYPYFYFFVHALLYGIGRFVIEFFRIDPREFWGPLSMSQWLSLVLVATSLIFFIKNRKEIAKSLQHREQ